MNYDPPLELEEALTLQPARKLARGAVRGAQVMGVTLSMAVVFVLVFQILLGWVGSATTVPLTLLLAMASFLVGAYARRHELPPAAAISVGADGITARSEKFTRFYPYGSIVDTRLHGTELFLHIDGGYAFRVPFRTRGHAANAQQRIAREMQARTQRLAEGEREQRDAVEIGEEARFIERQRQRASMDYRRGHQSTEALIAELSDPDFQLQQRIGAAVALAESQHPRAREAMQDVRQWTSSFALRDCLDALLDGNVQDDQLVTWIRQMHPKPRRFAPVGGVHPNALPAPPVRIEAPPRIAVEDAAANVDAPADAAEAELEAQAAAEAEERRHRR